MRLCRLSPGWLGIAALLLVHLVLGIDAARSLTVTHDEYWHLPAGLASWRAGRFDADNLNPPLTRMWDTLPLVWTSARVDPTVAAGDAFRLGDRFLSDNRERYDGYLAWARSMNVLFSVATGILLAVWAYELFGLKPAFLATAMWTFCPTVLAHASLVTPDMGAACLFTATLYSCVRFAGSPSWKMAGVVGTLLGLAQLAKFTDLLLYPLCAAEWFIVRWRNSGRPAITWRKQVAECFLIGAVSIGVLNAGYLFHGSFRPLNSYTFQSRALKRLAEFLGPVGGLPVPLPRDYLEGLDRQRRIMEGPHPVYLDGTWSLEGFGDYYVRSLAYKLPHAAQGLLIAALVGIAFPGRNRRLGRAQWLLWVPVVGVIGIASSIGMQLGLRYVLPALPLLHLFTAQAARWLAWKKFPVRSALLLPLIAALPFSLRFHPHHLAYFNELAGGPAGGRRHLVDSNLDWGQDLRELASYLQRHQTGDIGLAYFGMTPPAELGIDYHIPPSWRPQPGWYAVSVNFVCGRPHTVRNPDGSLRSADYREFAYFSDFEPVARIGYSIDVYHLSADDIARVRSR